MGIVTSKNKACVQPFSSQISFTANRRPATHSVVSGSAVCAAPASAQSSQWQLRFCEKRVRPAPHTFLVHLRVRFGVRHQPLQVEHQVPRARACVRQSGSTFERTRPLPCVEIIRGGTAGARWRGDGRRWAPGDNAPIPRVANDSTLVLFRYGCSTLRALAGAASAESGSASSTDSTAAIA